MKRSYFATALLSGLLISGAAFAQSSTSTTQPTAAQKQKTDGADVTGQYNFPTPGGQYSNRGATKQQ
jgi:hypothetical protein